MLSQEALSFGIETVLEQPRRCTGQALALWLPSLLKTHLTGPIPIEEPTTPNWKVITDESAKEAFGVVAGYIHYHELSPFTEPSPMSKPQNG